MDLRPVLRVQIITLQDNYIDLVSGDNSPVVLRAAPVRGTEFSNSILAEHGFSALVRVSDKEEEHSVLMDFGLSEDTAARNAEALSLDLSKVEAAVLSHGHMDHFGGMNALAKKIGKKNLDLLVHPGAFKKSRHVEPFAGLKITLPVVTREKIKKAGFHLVEEEGPTLLADGRVLCLGEIPRKTEFEQGMPNAFCAGEDGCMQKDVLEDDTALCMNLSGKGLVVLSGCAHSGIINTVRYAQDVTGIAKVHAVMGGFHLSGPHFTKLIEPTVAALAEIGPDWVIPTHCTGRNAVLAFEKAFGPRFILNMAGTTLTFAA
ncbi:MAG: MBL fold metallo-hydrolase [Thermodesulfobacteriota bacterium]